eukprot:15443537-Alexandrium_andersonii.AAC.1
MEDRLVSHHISGADQISAVLASPAGAPCEQPLSRERTPPGPGAGASEMPSRLGQGAASRAGTPRESSRGRVAAVQPEEELPRSRARSSSGPNAGASEQPVRSEPDLVAP